MDKTLAEIVAEKLDETQRATREALRPDPNPPSGRGDDRPTVIPPARRATLGA